MKNRIEINVHYLITNGILFYYLVFNNKMKQLKYYKLFKDNSKTTTS